MQARSTNSLWPAEASAVRGEIDGRLHGGIILYVISVHRAVAIEPGEPIFPIRRAGRNTFGGSKLCQSDWPFDERAGPIQMKEDVLVRDADVAAIIETLGL